MASRREASGMRSAGGGLSRAFWCIFAKSFREASAVRARWWRTSLTLQAPGSGAWVSCASSSPSTAARSAARSRATLATSSSSFADMGMVGMPPDWASGLAPGAAVDFLDLLPALADLEAELLTGLALGEGEEAVGRLGQLLKKGDLELGEEEVDVAVRRSR
jgi:hypothetical protein